MSRCISSHGEYGAHELDSVNRCEWCRVWECPVCGECEVYPLDGDDHDCADDSDDCAACDSPLSSCARDHACCDDCTHGGNFPPAPIPQNTEKAAEQMRDTMQRMEAADERVSVLYDTAYNAGEHHAGCHLLTVHLQPHEPCDCRCHELPNSGAST